MWSSSSFQLPRTLSSGSPTAIPRPSLRQSGSTNRRQLMPAKLRRGPAAVVHKESKSVNSNTENILATDTLICMMALGRKIHHGWWLYLRRRKKKNIIIVIISLIRVVWCYSCLLSVTPMIFASHLLVLLLVHSYC